MLQSIKLNNNVLKKGKKCKQNEMHTYYKKTKKILILDFIMAIHY